MNPDLSYADIRDALEHAVRDLQAVERTWMADADTAASAALSVDPSIPCAICEIPSASTSCARHYTSSRAYSTTSPTLTRP
jgi:hypothetical protein